MIRVWGVGGFPAELTRAAMVRWATAEALSRINIASGQDAIKSLGIGNNCTVVMSIVDEAIALAQCFTDSPAPPMGRMPLGAYISCAPAVTSRGRSLLVERRASSTARLRTMRMRVQ